MFKNNVVSLDYDDPKITDEYKLQVDACLNISEDTKADG